MADPNADLRQQKFEAWLNSSKLKKPPYREAFDAGWQAAQPSSADQHDLRNCPAMRALESLTPGGSEYIDDIPRCVATVREGRDSLMKAFVDTKRRLTAENGELRKRPSSADLEKLAREIAQEVNAMEMENFGGRNLPPTAIQNIALQLLTSTLGLK